MEHPITPPVDYIRKWNEEAATAPMADQRYIAIQAARWGADQELAACCEWLEQSPYGFSHKWLVKVTANDVTKQLRAARRPQPPSLKEQASDSLDEVVKCLKMLVPGASVDGVHIETIRRALESLPDPQD